MHIPSYYVPIRANKTKAKSKSAVTLDKSDTNTDATEQPKILPMSGEDKRAGEDRRKRNIKPLLDTRSGRDRRYSKFRPSIDIKA